MSSNNEFSPDLISLYVQAIAKQDNIEIRYETLIEIYDTEKLSVAESSDDDSSYNDDLISLYEQKLALQDKYIADLIKASKTKDYQIQEVKNSYKALVEKFSPEKSAELLPNTSSELTDGSSVLHPSHHPLADA